VTWRVGYHSRSSNGTADTDSVVHGYGIVDGEAIIVIPIAS